MKYHLIYLTFGETTGTVYKTQVIELINEWSKREKWKVTLVQIADNKMFTNLNSNVEKIYIRRNKKLLSKRDIDEYCEQLNKAIKLNNNDKIYFNSRGYFAYNISRNFLNKYKINYKANNLDVRGISEEFKYSLKTYFLYPVLDRYYKKTIKSATSITTVSTNLKQYLIKKYEINDKDKPIKVIPTLSIMRFKKTNTKRKNIVYNGNIAWISTRLFVDKILEVKKIINPLGWKIDIIGSSKVVNELKKSDISFHSRMLPEQLYSKLVDYHSGLVLRDKSIVNRVSAPCKISDYLCLGIPVIYSGEIGSIKDFIEKYPEMSKFILSVDEIKKNKQLANEYFNISDVQRKLLSQKARTYFGVNAVVDSYIDYFKSISK